MSFQEQFPQPAFPTKKEPRPVVSSIRRALDNLRLRMVQKKEAFYPQQQLAELIKAVIKKHHLTHLDEATEINNLKKTSVIEVKENIPSLTEAGKEMSLLLTETERAILFIDEEHGTLRPFAERQQLLGALLSWIEVRLVAPMLELTPEQAQKLGEVYEQIVRDPQDTMEKCFTPSGMPKSSTDEEAVTATKMAKTNASEAAIRHAAEMITVVWPELSENERDQRYTELINKIQVGHFIQVTENLLDITLPNLNERQLQKAVIHVLNEEQSAGGLSGWAPSERTAFRDFILKMGQGQSVPLTVDEEKVVGLWGLSTHLSWLRIQPDLMAFTQLPQFLAMREKEQKQLEFTQIAVQSIPLQTKGEQTETPRPTFFEEKAELRLYRNGNEPSPAMLMEYYTAALEKSGGDQTVAFAAAMYVLLKDFFHVKKNHNQLTKAA